MDESAVTNKDWSITNNGRTSIVPSGWWGNGPENLVEIENFIPEDQLNFLEAEAKGITSWDVTETHTNEDGIVIYDAGYWANRVATRQSLDRKNPEIGPIIKELNEKLQIEIEKHFNVKVGPVGQTIVRWLPGQKQIPHADKELIHGEHIGKPNDFPWFDIASLFYLNEDYEGGELFHPFQNSKFKPKRGAAYFFPGDRFYAHGITEIKSGIRYTCPFFWNVLEHTDGRDHTTFELPEHLRDYTAPEYTE